MQRTAFKFSSTEFPFPPSGLCANCRLQHRLSFRNERSLYHRISAHSGKKILSLYHETPLWGPVYAVMPEEEWRADSFDPLAFGREIDFNRPFFEQYAELHKAIPRMSILNISNDNSPYTSHTGYSRNCYLLPCSENCEDCYYGRFLQQCKNCVDCTSGHRSELCYECFQFADCYNCAFLSLSENCHDCYFSESLTGCHHCLFCSNLHRAEYRIFNQPIPPLQFKQQAAALMASAAEIAKARQEWQRLSSGRAHRPANIRNSENCSGDFILDSKNCTDCVDITRCEDCAETVIGYGLRDSRSCSNFYLNSELNYEILGSTELYHCAFGFYLFRSRDILYSELIYDSQQLFGCAGMTRAAHCILNRQYSPEEYQKTAARLAVHMQATGEWGRQLPARFSAFGYNETVAADLFPLSKVQALERGFLWREQDGKARSEPTINFPPDEIENCSRELSKEIFRCQASGEPFKLIGPELDFHLRQGWALPRCSPAVRHQQREHLRFPAVFHTARCSKCSAEVRTNVPAGLAATLHCESCFQALF